MIQKRRIPARALIVLDCVLLLAFSAYLIRPLFKLKYMARWGSIESTFISDARFLKDHWPRPKWQPLWYGGTRFDYVYPPALRYGTALLARTPGYVTPKAYHVYTAFFYCLGIAGAYLLIRVGSRSRGMALLGGAATALLSPSLLFITEYRIDAGYGLPVRLGALVKYGEGPHMTALALIPFALAFAWRAFERRRAPDTAVAGIFAAAVVSNNFYGATALAMFYPILLWTIWITRRDWRAFIPAALIPVIAYGLTAFWLTPSYLAITLRNMQYVSEKGNWWSPVVLLGATAIFVWWSRRFADRRPERAWTVFALGSLGLFALNTLGNYFVKFRVIGEPMRLVPELDYVFILGALVGLRWMWNRGRRTWKTAAAALTIAGFSCSIGYWKEKWSEFPVADDYRQRIEYKVTEWVAKNMPDSRIYATGSVRFWYNAWFDLPQLGGGSEQGLLNGASMPATWEVAMGPTAEMPVLWMQCFGTDGIFASDKRSEEWYKDIVNPEKFEGQLEAVFNDGKGNFIYKIPRRWPWRARVVETAKLDACPRPKDSQDNSHIRPYAEMMEHGPDSPARLERLGTDAMRLRARVAPGESIVVQETYDTPWQAWSGATRLPIRKDAVGQMAIDPPPGDHDILLIFVSPLENVLGWWVTGLTALATLAMCGVGLRRRNP